jgi:hypothetical protein
MFVIDNTHYKMSAEQATNQRLQQENKELHKKVTGLTRKLRKLKKVRNELSKLKKKLNRGGCLLTSIDSVDALYWGADDGYVTIWRFPPGIAEQEDIVDRFGNKHYFGEEWGMFAALNVKTVTRKMLNADNWWNY